MSSLKKGVFDVCFIRVGQFRQSWMESLILKESYSHYQSRNNSQEYRKEKIEETKNKKNIEKKIKK